MATAGERLVCSECGATVLVVQAGGGEVTCHGKPMQNPAASPDAGAAVR